jgi:hypothetical protein
MPEVGPVMMYTLCGEALLMFGLFGILKAP